MQKKNLSLRKWIAIVAAGLLVVVYMLAMLIIPALPLADPAGEIVAVPRFELWLIYVASLSDLWRQWTDGKPAHFADRWPLIAGAAAWWGVAWGLGRRVIWLDGVVHSRGRGTREWMALAAGHGLLCQLVLLNAWTFGSLSWLGLAFWVAGAWAASAWWSRGRSSRAGQGRSSRAGQGGSDPSSSAAVARGSLGEGRRGDVAKAPFSEVFGEPCGARRESGTDRWLETDCSLVDRWSRRLIPLLGLASIWIAAVTLAGSCLPSFDADVREIEMLSIKEFMIQGSLAPVERHGGTLSPRGSVMPAMAIAACSEGWPEPMRSPPSMSALLQGVLTGQLIQCGLWLLAILLFVEMVRWSEGMFAAILVAFLLIAHPGMHELVRLGGGAGGAALWLMAGVGLLHSGTVGPPRRPPLLTTACIAAGAFGSGAMMGVAIGVPLSIGIVVAWWRQERGATVNRGGPKFISFDRMLRCTGMFALCLWMLAWPIRSVWYGASWWQHEPGFATVGRGVVSAGHEVGWAVARVLMDSVAHGLLLVPLAGVGILFQSDRRSRDAMGLGCIWLLAWWLFTDRLDRDWVVATPLLAWPAACGVSWLQRCTAGWVLAPCAWTALVWSVVVLSAWPLSDPRWLVPLERLTPNLEVPLQARSDGTETVQGSAGQGTDVEAVGRIATDQTAPRYCDWINRFAAHRGNTRSKDSRPEVPRVWLVVGNADTFFLKVPTISSGVRDRCWLEDWMASMQMGEGLGDPQPNEASAAVWVAPPSPPWFREHSVGYVVMDWQGLVRRDRILSQHREGPYRDWVRRMLEAGKLRRIPWDLNSGEAECFEVLWEE